MPMVGADARTTHRPQAATPGASRRGGGPGGRDFRRLSDLDPRPARTRAKFQVTDVNSHSLGIEGIDQRTGRKENVVLIARNTPLPARVTEHFVTKTANQSSIVVRVLEGESKEPEQCTPIAKAVLRQLPPTLAKGTKVEVSYAYGTNGRLSVGPSCRGTANELAIDLVREAGLSDERVARWRRVITGDEGFDAFGPVLHELLSANPQPTAPFATASPSGGLPRPVAMGAAGGAVVAPNMRVARIFAGGAHWWPAHCQAGGDQCSGAGGQRAHGRRGWPLVEPAPAQSAGVASYDGRRTCRSTARRPRMAAGSAPPRRSADALECVWPPDGRRAGVGVGLLHLVYNLTGI